MSTTTNSTPGFASIGSGPAAFSLWLGKMVAVWATLLFGTVLAFRLVAVDLPPPPAHDGPLTTQEALLAVNALYALVVGVLGWCARVRGWPLALLLFVAQFATATVVLQLDTLYFNTYVTTPLTNAAIGLLALQAMITTALSSIVGAVLFRPAAERPAALPSNMAARIALTAFVYVVLYYTAGGLIAWQSEAVRAHYGNGLAFHPFEMLIFEYVRGILWTLTALYIVTRLKGSTLARGLVLGLVFAVMTNASLFYPNGSLTWDVRQMHLIEVGISEFMYGILAAYILLASRQPRNLEQ